MSLLWVTGSILTGAGILLGAWAVRAAGTIAIEQPTALVTTGPFSFSRNPIYVAWTAFYVGSGFVVNSVWVFILLPIVVVVTHTTVKPEERSLERAFGDEYRKYQHRVRRYL